MSDRRCWIEIVGALIVAAACAWALPHVLQLFALINATIYVSMAVLALSLALVWGFGGILCFGQAAFFGLGGYAYAIAALNLTGTSWAVPIALVVPAAVAAILGYLMFFGRISDVYIGVITLTVTLILFN
ncbi:MAG: ABC transporter permease subunit, partial [Acetobacteraceae bacterium]